ncbi:MAG: endonuclease III [Firmicutes bacterium]|nr:endonuclease III [Bacillota bacterium]
MINEKKRAEKIIKLLQKTYPHAQCGLVHNNPFQLLVATILSAQCTDKRVNIITKELFKNYSTAADLARLTPEELAEDIKGCGLHRNKSRAIIETCRILVNKYGGEVPRDREALEALPGVGRKTAGVVLGVAFGQPTLPVDTHVNRVAHRLELASGKNPETTEQELMQCIPRELWQTSHHLFIAHGRETCDARRPKCGTCPIISMCSKRLEVSVRKGAR